MCICVWLQDRVQGNTKMKFRCHLVASAHKTGLGIIGFIECFAALRFLSVITLFQEHFVPKQAGCCAQEELKGMADRINSMRTLLFQELQRVGAPGKWSHIVEQIGMFSYTGLTRVR